ncbi:hypothetical protein DXG01_003174 [Tephrocybe rancida]|nr:hypothetical protein DXG01_003174 [Tephrocybe rancida]
MATSGLPPAEAPEVIRHTDFYMEMVEDVLYRVPTYLFRSETAFFHSLLDAPDSSFGDEKVILRDDVTALDFQALLKLLYPMTFTVVRTLSDSEWISVLKVSTKWLMLEIRRMAIEHLSSAPLPIVDRITLARECSILPWLHSAYLALLDVKSELSEHDEVTRERIGLESTLKLHRARESILEYSAPVNVIRKEVEGEFSAELEMLGDQTAIERAQLAQTYNVSEWRRTSFIELAGREKPLSVDEAQALGLETAIRLCGAREFKSTLGVDHAVQQELEWDFGALKSYTAVERLVLAREYAMRVWVRDALLELGKRREPPTTTEALNIGLDTAIALCRARHYHDQSLPAIAACKTALEHEFQVEFAEVEVAGNQLLSKSEIETAQKRILEEKRLEEKRLEEKRLEEERLEEKRLEEKRLKEQRLKGGRGRGRGRLV